MSNTELRQFIHDLRNPLNNISMNAELGLLLCESSGNNTDIAKAFDTIVARCEQMAEQLNILE